MCVYDFLTLERKHFTHSALWHTHWLYPLIEYNPSLPYADGALSLKTLIAIRSIANTMPQPKTTIARYIWPLSSATWVKRILYWQIVQLSTVQTQIIMYTAICMCAGMHHTVSLAMLYWLVFPIWMCFVTKWLSMFQHQQIHTKLEPTTLYIYLYVCTRTGHSSITLTHELEILTFQS